MATFALVASSLVRCLRSFALLFSIISSKKDQNERKLFLFLSLSRIFFLFLLVGSFIQTPSPASILLPNCFELLTHASKQKRSKNGIENNDKNKNNNNKGGKRATLA